MTRILEGSKIIKQVFSFLSGKLFQFSSVQFKLVSMCSDIMHMFACS